MGRRRGMVQGVGYHSDTSPTSDGNGRHIFEYTTWCNMLKRCYNEASLIKRTTYEDKVVSDTWKDYGEFYKWCSNYKFKESGWQLDKDLLLKGNKVYGPEFCVFLPPSLNGVLLSCKAKRGELPIGVHFDKSRGKFKATCCNEYGKQWQKRFDTLDEAFQAYKQEKERVIKFLANQYKDRIDPRAYTALINYRVEITD